MIVSRTEKREGIAKGYIAGQMARYGYSDKDMQNSLSISDKTWAKYKNSPSTMPVSILWAVIDMLHLTPPQAASLALGKDLTAEDFRNYMCL